MEFVDLLLLEGKGDFARLKELRGEIEAGRLRVTASPEKLKSFFDRVACREGPKKARVPRQTSEISVSNPDPSVPVSGADSKNSILSLKPLDSPESRKRTSTSWVAIITLWRRRDYLAEQLSAIKSQSIPPTQIIVMINGREIPVTEVRELDGDLLVIESDINSLYTRWFLGYLSDAEYISVFDDDVVPGRDWIKNAMRCCDSYNALVGAAGRIYDNQGKFGFFEIVSPFSGDVRNEHISCQYSDIFVDWVCNSYFFRSSWIKYIFDSPRYNQSHKTFDDIQLATSLQRFGLRCVVPVQPQNYQELWASTKPEFGNDVNAIWKTSTGQHFSARKTYITALIDAGYVPVRRRSNLHRIILVIPFFDFDLLKECLISVAGQTYKNYIVVIVDDSPSRHNITDFIKTLNIHNFVILKNKTRQHPLRSRINAHELIGLSLNDIVVHLDGDDLLAAPNALSIIANHYSDGSTAATYGSCVNFFPADQGTFWQFVPYSISAKWNFSKDRNASSEEILLREISRDETILGWRSAPWGGLHARTYLYSAWLLSAKEHYVSSEGYLKCATDAAIFIPILDSLEFGKIKFIPDLSYCYRNGKNTLHQSGTLRDIDRQIAYETISRADFVRDWTAVSAQAVTRETFDGNLRDSTHASVVGAQITESNKVTGTLLRSAAVVTVVTPNYVADGITSLLTWSASIHSCNFRTYLFIPGLTRKNRGYLRQTLPKTIEILSEEELILKGEAQALAQKYGSGTDEYRWGMKSVVLLELIERGYQTAVFVDPDLFTVSVLDDVVEEIQNASVSVFPHFRDPDDEYLRKILYRDGFFNGGLIAITRDGASSARRLYERCLREMIKDGDRNRWDDQKYFDNFVLETDNLFINKDRGIDYNPWNYESVYGLTSPYIQSFLLDSGYFVRNWHMSTNLIKQSIDFHERHVKHRPIVFYYLFGLAILVMVLIYRCSNSERLLFGLPERLSSILNNISRLVSEDSKLYLDLRKICSLVLIDQSLPSKRLESFLEEHSAIICLNGFSPVFMALGYGQFFGSKALTGLQLEHALSQLRTTHLKF